MNNKNFNESIVLFEASPVRRAWSEKEACWYFSIVDIVALLTESNNPTDYLKKLRKRDKYLGDYLGTNCPQVEMITNTGKKRQILAGNIEQIFRIIQSITSPKAEPFKLWLAKVGQERMQEINDPEIALNRSRDLWQKHGRSQLWIQRRMTGQETRNKLTDYWSQNDVKKGSEFAILTNIIHEEWSDLSIQKHKNLKNLNTQNLRDHMSEEELLFSALAELSTRKIAEVEKTAGFKANKVPAKKGGQVAKHARQELESKIGKSIISNKNFLPPRKQVKK